MFDVEDVFEGISVWFALCAQSAWLWTHAFDDASDFFAMD